MDETTTKIRTALGACRLGVWPTPCEPRPGLAAALGLAALWVKREDRASPRYGGNKVRGLEMLLAGLPAGTVCVTLGGTASTHCLATALHARALGLRTVLVQFPQPDTPMSRALAAANEVAADAVERAPARVALPLALYRAWRRARALGGSGVRWIAGGGADPRAVLGQFLGGLELARQLAEPPDAIVVALGSSTTAAGLALAMAHLGWPTRIIGVRVAPWPIASAWRAGRLGASAGLLLRRIVPSFLIPRSAFRTPRFEVVDGLGQGYGHPTPNGDRATALAAVHGLTLDPTYTAKACGAMPEVVRRGYRRVVFWHTFAAPPAPPARPQLPAEPRA